MKAEQVLQEKEAEIALLRAEISAKDELLSDMDRLVFSREEAISQKEEAISQKDKIISRQETKVEQLLERIAWLLRQKFGQTRERIILKDPAQLALDLGLEESNPDPEAEPEMETVTYKRRKRKKHPGRKPLPEDLPRKNIIIEPDNLTDDMVCIGEEITEVLAKIPASFYVIRYIRKKYITSGQDGVKIGELPDRALPKSIADESLLADIIVSKYVDHLPLYRQLAIFRRQKIDIADSTIGNWISKTARLLEPLYEALKISVTQHSAYIQVDESPIKVLDRKKKGKAHQGYMWLYYDPGDKMVLFDYQTSREHRHVHDLLKDYEGLLQSDGYGAYEFFEKSPNVTTLGCLAHGRRKFFDAKANDSVRATWMLREIQKLYKIEASLRESEADHDMRKMVRQAEALPILEKIGQWLKEEYSQVLPSSSIGKAIFYNLTRWGKLSRYAEHGMAEIDNNLIENQVRPLAIGRKNYLFAGSHSGARNAAIFYSLLSSAKLNGLNPYYYLYTILRKLPTHPVNKLQELLPYNFKEAEPQQAQLHQLHD